MLYIDSLEDVMVGHAFIACFESAGGRFHIAESKSEITLNSKVRNFCLCRLYFLGHWLGLGGWLFSGLLGVLRTKLFVQLNSMESIWYWNLEFLLIIGHLDANDSFALLETTTRAALKDVHYYFGFFIHQGCLWHAIQAFGFDFKWVPNAAAI